MVRCPICVEQDTVKRDYLEEKDLIGHLIGMHVKYELAKHLAKALLKVPPQIESMDKNLFPRTGDGDGEFAGNGEKLD